MRSFREFLDKVALAELQNDEKKGEGELWGSLARL